MSKIEDDLQRHTECFVPADEAFDNKADDCEEEDTDLQGQELDKILHMLDDEAGLVEAEDTSTSRELPKSISLHTVRQKGKLRCGYDHLAKMKCNDHVTNAPLIELEHSNVNEEAQSDQDTIPENSQNNPTLTKQDIVKVVFEKIS